MILRLSFLVELEFGNIGFREEGKTGELGEKPVGAKERTNATYIWRGSRDSH